MNQMPVLSVYRNEELRPHHFDHFLQFGPRCVAAGVNVFNRIVQDFSALTEQLVRELRDRHFVSGNLARTENDQILL